MMNRRFSAVAVAVALMGLIGEPEVAAFSVANPPTRTSTSALHASRRLVLETSFAAALGSIVIAFPAWADGFDDLSMPTEEEQKKSEEDAMAERLRRKAELQKAQSKPVNFKESMEAEKRKQESLKKSKEERRNAMCEELGRGC